MTATTKTIVSIMASGAVLLKGESRIAKATATKAVNYTPEQEAKMKADYLAGATTEAIAQELGKTVRSVVAKLSRLGVYKKKEYTTKTGVAPVKKDELADKLTELCDLTEAEADSLTKATKTALQKIIAKIEAPAKGNDE